MAFQKLAEKSQKRSRLSGDYGQGMVEYLLMIVVSVSLLVGLSTALFKPVREFLNMYMGSYVSCLLETGELPSLGNDDAKTVLQDQGCNAHFQAATLKFGRPPAGSSSSPNSSDSSKSSSSGSSSSSKSSSSDKKNNQSSSSPTPNQSRNLLNQKSTALESRGSSEKVTDIPVDPGQTSSLYNRQGAWGSQSVGRSAKATAVGMAGMTEDEKRKQSRRDNANQTVATGEDLGGRTKKVTIKKPEPKVDEIKDEPMTFGSFLRLLLIAGIIIAIIVVLGGQALKISKSRE